MTDTEIIKALESEIHLAEYVDSDYCSNVNLEIIKSALNLITRQQAEIESLKIFREYAEKRASDYRTMRDKYLNAKSEAVKEFAERLKNSFFDNGYESPDVDFDYFVDNLLKDKEGEDA